jgi:hypothetical protein
MLGVGAAGCSWLIIKKNKEMLTNQTPSLGNRTEIDDSSYETEFIIIALLPV